MTIRFTIPGVPVAQPRQRHRVIQSGGRAFATNYTPSTHPVAAFKALTRLAASQVYSGSPLDCPLVMLVVFVFQRPASVRKRDGTGRLPHTGRPDAENCLKAVQDALEGAVYRNDSLIYDVRAIKWKAAADEQPHTEVEIVTQGEL